MGKNIIMNIINQKVIHKTLGEGIITEHSDNKIFVSFSFRTSKFLFPSAFKSLLFVCRARAIKHIETVVRIRLQDMIYGEASLFSQIIKLLTVLDGK